MNTARYHHAATLLKDGQVLVTGGLGVDGNYTSLDSAELYNPSTGEWTLTGSMTQSRCLHSATLLSNGDVLVAGGVNSIYDSANNIATMTAAEIYNPSTGTWTATGSLNVSRASAATLLLENGEVLSAGGYNKTANSTANTYLTSAELYNLVTGTWSLTGSISGSVGLPTTPVLLSNWTF